jgi:hypothetical protein
MDVSAASNSGGTGGMVCILTILGLSPVYLFGYHRARMHRANQDYKKTKAGLPGLRKDFWSTWWAAARVGFVILLVLGALFMWMVRGGHSQADVKPSPSMSSHKP